MNQLTTDVAAPVLFLGANRGMDGFLNGAGFLDELAKQRSPLFGVKVQCADLVPARAQALAATLSARGVRAVANVQDGRKMDVPAMTRGNRLLVAVTDDPVAQAALVEGSLATLTLAGLIIGVPSADNALGAGVIGVGALFKSDDTAARQNAIRLFTKLAKLAGGQRTTSRAVSSPVLNDLQFDHVRLALYQDSGKRAWQQLRGEPCPSTSGLSIAYWTGGGCQSHPLQMARRNGMTRAAMIESTTITKQAIVYYDPAAGKEDWLFFNLPSNGRVVAIELPEPAVPQMDRASDSAINQVLREPIYVTD